MNNEVTIDLRGIKLAANISQVKYCRGWVIFAHGSGSSRLSPRNTWVANNLNNNGYSTLLFDLLSEEEDLIYENRFNLPLLAERLIFVTKWIEKSEYYNGEPIAYFGASTGAAAALIAASRRGASSNLFTVISRGGRPDLAGSENLQNVYLPVLLIVGKLDQEVIKLNEYANDFLQFSEIKLIDGASHLFEEEGTLDQVIVVTIKWLNQQLPKESELPGNL
jgi:putative phosphoribosyl transferase